MKFLSKYNDYFELRPVDWIANKAVIIDKNRFYSALSAGERDVEREKKTSAFHINHSIFISLIRT